MYAVIRTGGKQYRVAKDDVIKVERLPGEAGDTVTLDQVLMLGGNGKAEVGAPLLADATVTATVLEQARASKILVFKKKRRNNYRRKRGHRQDLTVLRITDILAKGGKAAASKAATKPAAKADVAEKPTAKPKTAKATPAKKPATKKPATKAKSTAAAKKPAAKKPTAKKPAAKKPASKAKE